MGWWRAGEEAEWKRSPPCSMEREQLCSPLIQEVWQRWSLFLKQGLKTTGLESASLCSSFCSDRAYPLDNIVNSYPAFNIQSRYVCLNAAFLRHQALISPLSVLHYHRPSPGLCRFLLSHCIENVFCTHISIIYQELLGSRMTSPMSAPGHRVCSA